MGSKCDRPECMCCNPEQRQQQAMGPMERHEKPVEGCLMCERFPKWIPHERFKDPPR